MIKKNFSVEIQGLEAVVGSVERQGEMVRAEHLLRHSVLKLLPRLVWPVIIVIGPVVILSAFAEMAVPETPHVDNFFGG
jgi:hypothetical protein